MASQAHVIYPSWFTQVEVHAMFSRCCVLPVITKWKIFQPSVTLKVHACYICLLVQPRLKSMQFFHVAECFGFYDKFFRRAWHSRQILYILSGSPRRVNVSGFNLQLHCKFFLVNNNIVWIIPHFTVVCLVAKRLNRSEARVEVVVIQTSPLFVWKSLC